MHLSGIVPPMVTPFGEEEGLDEAALRAEVEYMIEEANVPGIVVGGSTGEGHTLETDEFRTLAAIAVDAARGRIPVVAGIIVDSTRQAVRRAQSISDLDIAALQVTPVHYLFRPDDDAMVGHFARLASEAAAPVMIYNVVPWSYCSPALLTRIITEVDGVIGVKQSAGDMKLLADLLLMLDGRGSVFSAVDALLYPSFLLGADGAIAAILTACPQLCVELWQAVQAGDHVAARRLHEHLLRIWNAIEAPNLPANVKTAMNLQGRNGGVCRAPMPATSAAQREAIRAALAAAGVSLAPIR